MAMIIGMLADDPSQIVIATDPAANDDTVVEKPCGGCGHGTLNTHRVDEYDSPCCGDPWCTRIVGGGRLDQLD